MAGANVLILSSTSVCGQEFLRATADQEVYRAMTVIGLGEHDHRVLLRSSETRRFGPVEVV